MKRHRIYYGIWLVFCGLLFWIMNEKYTAALFFTFLLLPFLSLGMTALAFLNIHAEMKKLPSSAQKGTPLQAKLEIENKGFLFCPYVQLLITENPGIISPPEAAELFSLGPRKRVEQVVTLQFRLRGSYQMGCEALEALDFLKLFRLRKSGKNVQTVLVYPQIRKIRFLPDILGQNGEESVSVQTWRQENSDVFDLRPYEEHDSMKNIHWKLSAKSEELIYKKYAAFDSIQAVVAVNLCGKSETSPECQDEMLEALVSLLSLLISQRKTSDFLYADTEIRTEKIASVHKLREIYHLSAILTFNGTIPFGHMLGQYIPEVNRPIAMFLLTASVDAALQKRIETLSAFGHRVILIDFAPSEETTVSGRVDYLRPEDLY